MLRIKVIKNNLERALREYKFKRRRTKLDQELREGKQFTKPTTKRRKQKLQAKYKNKF